MDEKKIKLANQNCLERYVKHCERISMNKKSIKTRKAAINQFLNYLFSKKISIQDVSHVDIEDFLETEKNNTETSLSTVNGYYSFLKGFFKFCKVNEDNVTLDFEKVNFKKIIQRDFETFTADEIKETFEIISNTKNQYISIRDKTMFKILFYSGCTLSELYTLNVYSSQNDVLVDDNYILMDEKEIYFTVQSFRKLPLPISIIKDIKTYREIIEKKIMKKLPEGWFLFMSLQKNDKDSYCRMNYSTLQQRMIAIKNKSSYKEKKVSIKNIRHTVISELINNGKGLDLISEIVGLDIASLKYYIKNKDSFDKEIEKIMKKEHPFREYFI